MTPLIWASWYAHVDVASELLNRGANIEAARNSGMTPLMYANAMGRVDVSRELLSRGAEIEATTNNNGRKALLIVQEYREVVVALLLYHSATDT